MTTLPRFSRADGPAAIAEALQEAGAAIVVDAAGAALLARLQRDLAPWFAAALPGEGPFFGRRTRRFSALPAKAAAAAEIAIDPVALETVETALGLGGPHCDCIQLNLTQAIAIGPGEPAQALHRDDGFFPFRRDFETMINVLWTLDPFTTANGATRIAPGSHRWPRSRQALDHELVTAEAPAGAAVIWLGATLHGGGANQTAAERRGVVMSYSLGWLAPAEKLLLSIPADVARNFPERLQRLLGYQTHRPNLGWVEGRDPLQWLCGEVGALAPAADNLTPAQADQIAATHGL